MASKKIIQITVNARQANEIAKSFDDKLKSIDKTALGMGSVLKRMQGYFVAMFSLRGLQALANWTDQFTLLEARIKTFKREGESSIEIQTRLLDIAKKNGLQLNTSVDAYTKFNNALKESKISSQGILDLIQATSSAFKIYGVGGEQANSAILQLSQGLQKGRLDGDEFKSVSENAGILLEIFAKQAGIARGELKDFAAQGRLTTEVMVNGLLGAMEDLNSQAQDIPLTFNQMTNASMLFVAEFFGSLEKRIGVFSVVGIGMLFFAENIDAIGIAAAVVASVHLPKLIVGIKSLYTIILANPWIALATALAFVAVQVYKHWDTIKRTFLEGYLYLKEKMGELNLFLVESGVKLFTKLKSSKFTSFLVPDGVLEGEIARVKIARKSLIELKKERQDFLNSDVKRVKAKEKVTYESTSVAQLTREKERADKLAAINETFSQGKLTLSDYTQKVLDLNVAYDDLFSTTERIGTFNSSNISIPLITSIKLSF